MTSLITPVRIVLFGIAAMLMAMVIGPMLSPPAFSWLRHTTSEQAGQHMPGAWIMRAGFVAYGLAIFAAALRGWATRPLIRGALALFGLGLIGAAVWSNTPIVAELPADPHEDFLHSMASSLVGAAFAAACAARIFAPGGSRSDVLAWAGLVMSIAIPLAMVALPDARGAMQRAMFAFSFVFVAREFTEPSRRDMSNRT